MAEHRGERDDEPTRKAAEPEDDSYTLEELGRDPAALASGLKLPVNAQVWAGALAWYEHTNGELPKRMTLKQAKAAVKGFLAYAPESA
jgi:hypothetical protein